MNYYSRLEEINQEAIALQNEIAPLNAKLHKLGQERRELKSRLFIQVNQITLENVEMSHGDGKPWFGHVLDFITWMKSTGSSKNWAEWNGQIYRTSDLFANRMPDTPALIEHLPS